MAIPEAQAGPNQSHAYSTLPQLVTLAGSASNGPLTAWEWSMLTVPPGSSANSGANNDFTNGVANIQNPQFTADVDGAYVLQLRAQNVTGWSDPDSDKENGQSIIYVLTEKLGIKIPGRFEYIYDLDLNETLKDLESEIYDHHTRHEDGNNAEINVGGLSGELADDQNAKAIRTTTGPTLLTVGAITDGQFLKRSGTTVIGDTISLPVNNFVAILDPTINNDIDEGYTVGSRWLNTTSNIMFVCTDNTDGAAIWIRTAIKGNYSATINPTINNDVDENYVIGSIWVNTTTDTVFICADNTDGAAVWINISDSAASPLTTKGDLFTYGTADDRLPLGDENQILSVDSLESTGLKWVNSVSHAITHKATNFAEIQKVIASDPTTFDFFGRSVSIDGNYAVVGAYEGNANLGSAYIFEENNGTWTQVQKITASDGILNDHFGFSVAISGDYVIVGAPEKNSQQGAAYIFERSGGVWPATETKKILASGGLTGDQFGYSVSIDGDYAIVGAHAEDNSTSDDGSAYIFERSGGVWPTNETKKILAGDPEFGAQFGYSVAIFGDYAIVGSNVKNDLGSQRGAAYIFERSGGLWPTNETQKIIASDRANGDFFGQSVSIYGDYAIVGAPGSAYTYKGAAYIFERSGGVWPGTETKKILASDGVNGDQFGISVDIFNNYSVIGAYTDDSNKGSVYIHERINTIWSTNEILKLTASDGVGGDEFGISVSINNFNLIIGAHKDNTSTGGSYFFGTLATDSIRIDELNTPTDNTNLNVSVNAHGLCPKLDNDVTHYLNGQGSYTESNIENEEELISTGETSYQLTLQPLVATNSFSGYKLDVYKNGVRMRHVATPTASDHYHYNNSTPDRTCTFLSTPGSVYHFVYRS